MREEFNLYANVWPARTLIPRGRYEAIDIVLVRENTEGLYVGFEHYIPIGDDQHWAGQDQCARKVPARSLADPLDHPSLSARGICDVNRGDDSARPGTRLAKFSKPFGCEKKKLRFGDGRLVGPNEIVIRSVKKPRTTG